MLKKKLTRKCHFIRIGENIRIKRELQIVFLIFILASIVYFIRSISKQGVLKTNQVQYPILTSVPSSSECASKQREEASYIQNSEREILDVVQKDLAFLFSVAQHAKEASGMGTEASLEKTRLSRPFMVYSIPGETGRKLNSDQDLICAMEPTEFWFVPVDWGDGPGVLVDIVNRNGSWRWTGFGDPGASLVVRSILTNYPLQDVFSSVEKSLPQNFWFLSLGTPTSPKTAPIKIVIFSTDKGLQAIELDTTSQLQIEKGLVTQTPALSLVKEIFEKE